MAVDGSITPLIDQVVAFERATEAMAHVAKRRARGMVAVVVAVF